MNPVFKYFYKLMKGGLCIILALLVLLFSLKKDDDEESFLSFLWKRTKPMLTSLRGDGTLPDFEKLSNNDWDAEKCGTWHGDIKTNVTEDELLNISKFLKAKLEKWEIIDLEAFENERECLHLRFMLLNRTPDAVKCMAILTREGRQGYKIQLIKQDTEEGSENGLPQSDSPSRGDGTPPLSVADVKYPTNLAKMIADYKNETFVQTPLLVETLEAKDNFANLNQTQEFLSDLYKRAKK